MQTLTVPAPAKLNLFLHVTGRRDDGYHRLESVLALIDFGDVLTIASRDDAKIVLTQPLPAVPPVHSATTSVFASAALKRDTPPADAGVFPPDFGTNDLQPVAIAMHHAIGTAIDALENVEPGEAGRKALSQARMTGSGSAVFRIFYRGVPASEIAC